MKRVTSIGGPVVTTAAFASPMRVTGVFGTPECVTAGSSSEAFLGFACAVDVTAAFASPLILPVKFANPAKFVTDTCVEPVTANGGPVVKSPAMFVTEAYMKRVSSGHHGSLCESNA